MFVLNSQIIFDTKRGRMVIRQVCDVEVHASVNRFTDTAKISLPRIAKVRGSEERDLTKIVKRNDGIEVLLGYGDNLETVFKGYVKSVSTGNPMVIECENKSWELKQKMPTATIYKKFNLREFVKKEMPEYIVNIADIELGEVRIHNNVSLAGVFDYLMQNYPLRFYFRGDKFYGVLPSIMQVKDSDVDTHRFDRGKNMVSENLTYVLEDEININIVAKNILKDNRKIEVRVPRDGAGETRTFLVASATTIEELQAFAEEKLKEYKKDRMDGSFTAFGQPFVQKGDIVHLTDSEREECHNKRFFVEEVNYFFGKNGYRQKIKLGGQIR